MRGDLTSKNIITINASPDKVWRALTDPEMIKQYLFGTEASSDWKKGSSLTYRGEWNGKPYEDKGTIIDMQPGKLLHTTYYSPMSGKEDKPENYNNVIYTLDASGDGTTLTLTQDNIKDEAELEHMNKNWSMVLDAMKRLLEK